MKRRYLQDEDDSDFVINLSDIPESQMTLADFKRMAVRNQAYKTVRSQSGLTQSAWCFAMNSTEGRDNSYVNCETEVPNSVLNDAAMVSRKIETQLKYCRKVIIHEKTERL